jgi:hypothetical protein
MDLLGKYRVFALLLDLECPSYVEGHVLLVVLEHKHLPTTLWWEQALVLGGALEEAGHVVGAHVVTPTRSRDKQLALALLASADHAALLDFRHRSDCSVSVSVAWMEVMLSLNVVKLLKTQDGLELESGLRAYRVRLTSKGDRKVRLRMSQRSIVL